MGRTIPLPGAILLALLTALWLAVAAPALAAGATVQRTISNVATIEWDLAGGKVGQQSNRIDISVGPNALPASLLAYRFASGPEGLAMPVRAPQCGAGETRAPLGSEWQGQGLDP